MLLVMGFSCYGKLSVMKRPCQNPTGASEPGISGAVSVCQENTAVHFSTVAVLHSQEPHGSQIC